MNLRVGFNSIPFNKQVRFSGPPEGTFEAIGDYSPPTFDPPEPKDKDVYGRFPSPVISMDDSGSGVGGDVYSSSTNQPANFEIGDTQE